MSAQTTSPLYYAWTDTLKGIYYGPGSLKSALPQLLGTLKASRALVVTGKTLYEKVIFNTDVCDR
jgi:alcohol dehydrogenase class IV